MSESLWVDRTIADCLTTSFAGEWGTEPEPGNAVVLRATDIDNDGHVIGFGVARAIPASKLLAKNLQDGDILLEGSGGGPGKPVGRVAFFDGSVHAGSVLCSNFFKTLRVNRNHVDCRFLWRKLEWFYRQPALLALQQQTTGIINLKFVEYLATTLSFPVDILEQSKVAEVLDTLDTTIRQTEVVIEKLKQVKQGLLHDLLTSGIDVNGELRPPQSQAPHLYKDSPLGWIPNEWGCIQLGELAENSVIGPFGSDLVASDYRSSGVPIVFVRDVKVGRFIWKSNVFVSSAKAVALSAHDVRPGDVIATKMGFPPCVAAVYPDSMPNGVITADIVRLRFNCSIVRSLWVSCSVNDAAVVKQVEQITAGVTRPKVTLRDVRNLVVRLPSLSEQDRILERVVGMDQLLDIEQVLLDKLSLQKTGLMDDLLTGRVRVTALLDTVGAKR